MGTFSGLFSSSVAMTGSRQCIISPLSNCHQDLRIPGGRHGNVKTKGNETHLGRLKKSLKVLAGHFVPSAT